MNDYLLQYVEYIRNTGGRVSIVHFDDDWEPIGVMVRGDLLKAGLVEEKDGFLTERVGKDE